MGWIAAAVVLAVALVILALLPVQVHLTLNHRNFRATLRVRVRVAFLRLERTFSLGDKVAMAAEHMWKRWRATAKAIDPDLQETITRVPRKKLVRSALPGLRYLGRSARCSSFRLRLEVGGFDAFDSAILAGAGWGGASMLVAQFARWVRLERPGVKVAVVPNYDRPILRTDLDCILTVRLGKAIIAIAMLLRQELRHREVVAWLRDSWRRKGDKTGGRTPDSRPDEDGHGEP